MPRPFSDTDRTRVHERLLQAAREHFTRFGYRRANVGDIARDAGIAKGTVYLFFRSKVDLFVAVAMQAEAEMRMRVVAEVGDRPASIRAHLERLFRLQMEMFAEHPFLRVLTDPAEAGALFRDLPQEAAGELQSGDERFFADLVAGWGPGPAARLDPAMIVAAGRAIYALDVQRELIGEAAFAGFMDVFIAGTAAELEARAIAGSTSTEGEGEMGR